MFGIDPICSNQAMIRQRKDEAGGKVRSKTEPRSRSAVGRGTADHLRGRRGQRPGADGLLLAEALQWRLHRHQHDRRGRGDSGDTQPYAIEREVEDLEALIEEARRIGVVVRLLLRRGPRRAGGGPRARHHQAALYEPP